MLLDASDSQLVLIDYQSRLLSSMHDAEAVTANAVRLARMARLLDVPVWGTEHNPAKLGANPPEIRSACARTLAKMHFSAVADGLAGWLRPPANTGRPAQGNARSLPKHLQKADARPPERESIVVAGCEAHVCLLQTALDLIDEEFEVWVVTDACSARTERSRDAAFDRLAGAGCELVTTEMVGFEWLRGCEHPAFREVLALVR